MQENIVIDWLNRCGITTTIINEFNIHGGTHPIMGDCIVIPVLSEKGDFSFNKYRRNPMVDAKPKYLYDNGSKIALYAWFKAKEEKHVLITEGEKDCLVAWSKNIPAVTSTGGANSFQEEWADYFKDKEVTICFDNDNAGGQGMVKVLKYIPHASILFLPDRPGIKDISDYVAGGGNLNDLLKTKIKFNSLQDVIDDKIQRIATFRSTYFHDAYIDEHTTPVYVAKTNYTQKDTDQIFRAKGYPIPNLIEFNRQGKTVCRWHNDTDPSLVYYPKTNTCYCFACGKYADSIEVYRDLHSCSFKEAVKALNLL